MTSKGIEGGFALEIISADLGGVIHHPFVGASAKALPPILENTHSGTRACYGTVWAGTSVRFPEVIPEPGKVGARVGGVFFPGYIDKVVVSLPWRARANFLEPGFDLLLWLCTMIKEANPVKSRSHDPGGLVVQLWMRVDEAQPCRAGYCFAG